MILVSSPGAVLNGTRYDIGECSRNSLLGCLNFYRSVRFDWLPFYLSWSKMKFFCLASCQVCSLKIWYCLEVASITIESRSLVYS